MTTKQVLTPGDLGASLEVAGNKVEVKVDGLTIVRTAGGALTAAAVPNAVVRASGPLTGVAPTSADLGYNPADGRLYYRDAAGAWQPTAPANITINYWNSVTVPTATTSTTVVLPVNAPSRRAYGACWLANGELWAYGQNAHGTSAGQNGGLEHNRTPTAIPHNAMTFADAPVGRTPTFTRLWANRQSILLLDTQGKLWYRGPNFGRQSGIPAAATGDLLEQPTLIDFFVTNNLTLVDAWLSDGDSDDHYASVYAITDTGALYAWGRNATGQLGIGSASDTGTPTLASAPFGGGAVVQIHTSPAGISNVHAAALLADGRLFVAGINSNGQLGLGNFTQQNTWTLARVGCAYVHCPANATFGIDAVDGSLWCAGANGSGWFGRNSTTNTNTWVHATSFTAQAKLIRCNGYNRLSAYVVDTTGNLWVAGDNVFSQLGLGSGNATQQNSFVKLTPVQAPFQGQVKDVLPAGQSGATAYVITTAGQLWSIGYNGYGQRALGNRQDDAAYRSQWRQVGVKDKIIAGRIFAYDDSCTIVALDDQGKLRTCGYDWQMINPLGNWSSSLYSIN